MPALIFIFLCRIAMSDTLTLTKELIRRASLTPDDAGCQQVLIKRLEKLGFVIENLRFDDVDNLWARRGTAAPLFVFAGHTDVVPTGDINKWTHPPFDAVEENGFLYGRGAADMKSGLAAMVVACEQFIQKNPNHNGSIAFLITSDEEGVAKNGTVKVVEHLQARNEHMDWCLVGEPSSTEKIGDVVKNGRRGSLGATLTVHGIQGHVAYPHLAKNPIHLVAPLLAELTTKEWDQGNDFFPPTSFQISNINAGTGVTNVIPAQVEIQFNLRYSTEITHEQIQSFIISLLEKHQLNYDITWGHSGFPFLTDSGELVSATQAAIEEICNYSTELSTAGGTSDGRFIAPTGTQVLELGPVNATIHKIDECVKSADLDQLMQIYRRILEKLLIN